MREFGLRAFWVCCMSLAFAASAFGTTCAYGSENSNPQRVYQQVVAAADYKGCLQTNDAIFATGGWASTTTGKGFEISWNITPGALWKYEYTINAVSTDLLDKGLSHIIIGLSSNCGVGCISGVSYPLGSETTGPTLYEPGGEGNSNPGLPGKIYGLKIDTPKNAENRTFSFSFLSNRVAVWQNFYAKDGKTGNDEIYAYNKGDWDGDTNLESGYFIAAPDSVVPEPGFYGALSIGLAGLYLTLRRRRKES